MNKIKVASIQIEPIKANAQANCEKIFKLLEHNNETNFDLIVLPEFFNTGINLTNEEFIKYAEFEKDSISLKNISELAKKYKSYIVCGSILFNDNNKIYNRSYLIDRKGFILAKYDKIHLFNYFGGNEGSYTYPGEKLCVAKTVFGTIGLATCFDLKFPEHFLNLTKMGAEIITLPAAWSIVEHATEEFRTQHFANWRTMNISRALDNVGFLISANLVGDIHSMFKGMGHSMIVDYDGKILNEADNTKDIIITAELDMVAQRKTRKIFPRHLL